MIKKPTLSIVVPTTGKFSDYWLEQLLAVRGNVEMVIVYPPGIKKKGIIDVRVKEIVSPFRGEIMQRLVSLFNSSGEYVLSMNEDQFVHPDVADFTIRYFKRFPGSWVLRLHKKSFGFSDKKNLIKSWANMPDIENIEVCNKNKDKSSLYNSGGAILEVPIAPFDKIKFNPLFIFWPFINRTDHCGIHMENFDQRIWKNEIVQKSLCDLVKTIKIVGPLKWIPFWCLDRLLGLYIQAKFFRKDLVIGHWMPLPEQLRDFDIDPSVGRHGRFYVAADILLLKRFPKYGYFWNLILTQLWGIPKRAFWFVKRKLFGK